MPSLALLNEELAQNVERRKAIRDEWKDKTLPKAALDEMSQLDERSKVLHTLIDAEQTKELYKALDEEKAYMDEPVYKAPRVVALDEGDEKTLIKQLSGMGWELNNGQWLAPLANGKHYAIFPEEVFIGPIPTDDPVAAHYVKQTRRVMQPDYRDAWVKFIRMATKSGEAFAYAQLSPSEQKALSEGSDTAGGFTVPVDVQAQIGGRIATTSVMQRLASVTTTTRDRWAKPMVAPNTGSGTRNVYANDFVAAWVGETPSQASIDAKYEMFEIGIKKLRAYCLLSNDLIADSVGGLLSDLINSGGQAISLKKDEAFIAGPTGNAPGLEPIGILNHPLARTVVASNGMAYDVEGTTSNTISNTTSDAGSAAKIKQLTYQLAEQYADNATWLMRRATRGAIAGLVDGNGRPFWNSYMESGFGRPSLQVEGAPVVESPFVGADGSVSTTAATTPLIYGDISAYQIVDRNQLTVRVLTERFGDTDQTGLFLFVRTGGGLWNYDAIRTGVIAS